MIIDCHFHYSPDQMTLETILDGMNRAGIDKTALMPEICGTIHEPAGFVTALMRFALNRSLIRPIARRMMTRFSETGDVILPTGVIEIFRKPDNEKVFGAVTRYPDRFLAWCIVNPADHENSGNEYSRWMDHPGCVGVKAHPFWHRFPITRLFPVAELLVKKNAPLILHLGFNEHGDISALSNAFPNLKIILAHAGFPYYRDIWKKIRQYRNIRVDLSATAYVDRKTILNVTEYLGVDRCMFGTDGPYGSHGEIGFDHGMIKRIIESLFSDETVRRMILGRNFIEWLPS